MMVVVGVGADHLQFYRAMIDQRYFVVRRSSILKQSRELSQCGRLSNYIVIVAQGGLNLPEGSRTATSDILLPPITLPNHSY